MAADKPLFIVFEGIDGAGCETQANALARWLQGRKKKVLKLRYPDYNDPYGKLISAYLKGKKRISQENLFLAHFLNQIKDSNAIRESLAAGSFVVSDRYFASNLAYNCKDRADFNKGLKLAKTFALAKPDLIFYLDTKPEVGMKRKKEEKGSLDINERDIKKLAQASKNYRSLAKTNTFGQWIVINGNAPIHHVRTKVLEALWHYLR